MFHADKFKYIVSKNGFTLENVANMLGINQSTLYRKMHGYSDFTRNEITILREKLHLSFNDTEEIFFAP